MVPCTMERGIPTGGPFPDKLRSIPALVLCLLLAVHAALPADETPKGPEPRIEELEVAEETQGFLVSYRLVDVLPEEVLERIHSGIPVTFQHRVELLAKRALPLMPMKSLCRSTVLTTVQYESLTQEYHLTRTFEYLARGEEGIYRSGEENLSTAAVEDMKSWLTEIREMFVPYPPKPQESANRKLRVTTTIGRRFVLLVFPTSHTLTAEYPLDR